MPSWVSQKTSCGDWTALQRRAYPCSMLCKFPTAPLPHLRRRLYFNDIRRLFSTTRCPRAVRERRLATSDTNNENWPMGGLCMRHATLRTRLIRAQLKRINKLLGQDKAYKTDVDVSTVYSF
ncbi:hypothetical protein MATL_G00129720 [Megalops atlanticus]|uniref:Uncharacterized protein n=1 Tax=Megalops atlanticus TaxID=7932 RepID=A0A9D3PW79_MEGAT|nr:hypothetical protein MATL_G00129720 [Megalops atlanticus]